MQKRSLRSTLADALARVVLHAPGDVIYRLARRIVDRRRGDNDSYSDTNGELRVMRAFLPRAKVVFDVGANVGDWAIEALQIAPKATVHCFEPGSATFARLQQRALPGDVRLNQVALGAVSEERTYFVFGEGRGTNSLYLRNGVEDSAAVATESVPVITTDDYCAREGIERIDFLKIDVEGHEIDVLKGARGLLAAGRIGAVQLEYGGTYIDGGHLLRDVYTLLADAGAPYDVYKVFHNGILPVPAYRQTWETFQYSNWLLVRRGESLAIPVLRA
jgi:FkbM family methyltransferase